MDEAARSKHLRAGTDPRSERRERMARGTGFTSRKRNPEGGRNPKREAADRKANHQPCGTHCSKDQSLEVEVAPSGNRLAGERKASNDKGERNGDESNRLWRRRSPWTEEKSWTWLWDETSPRICKWSKPSRGCESLRTERSATPWNDAHRVDTCRDVAKRRETPVGHGGETPRRMSEGTSKRQPGTRE
jgi:hypothetical protein